MTMEKLTWRWSSRTNESERENKSPGMHVSIDGLSSARIPCSKQQQQILAYGKASHLACRPDGYDAAFATLHLDETTQRRARVSTLLVYFGAISSIDFNQ